MADRIEVVAGSERPEALSAETLETSRLLVEFLHAAYATRRLDEEEASAAGPRAHGPSPGNGQSSIAASTHGVRAAIHIYQHGERTVGQLAAGLGISYGWASRVVEELEAAGYVTRKRDVEDRRVVRVRLNPAKMGEVERAYQWRGEAVERALEPLRKSEREAVRAFLRRVTELLREGQPTRP
jgi:DNA-binding MarR family transcriptional regulator